MDHGVYYFNTQDSSLLLWSYKLDNGLVVHKLHGGLEFKPSIVQFMHQGKFSPTVGL